MGEYEFTNQEINKTDIKTEPVCLNNINWEDLLFQLRHLEIRILELIYLPESKPLDLNTLIKKANKLGYSDRTIRRKIQNLETLGLIRMIRSTIMIINPILELEILYLTGREPYKKKRARQLVGVL